MSNNKKKLLTRGHDKRVFDTSRWQNVLYNKRRFDGGVVSDSEGAVSRTLQSHIRETEESDIELGSVQDEAKVLGLEVFSQLYNKPERMDEINGPQFHPMAQDLLGEISDFENLRKQVSGDPDFSALAAGKLVAELAEKLPDLLNAAEKQREEDEKLDQMSDEEREQHKKDSDGLPGPLEMAKAAARGALRKAVKAASKETAETKKAMSGMLPGSEAVPPSHDQDSSDRMKLAELLKDNERMKEIMRKAGRMRRIAENDKKMRSSYAVEEVVDIEMGRDLARVVPSELAMMKHPLYRKLFLQKYSEGKLLQYKLEGNESLGRGPIIVLLDESGSMNTGGRHELARAFGLVAISTGLIQKRSVTIIGFNSRIRDIVQVDKHGNARQIFISHNGSLSGEELNGPIAASLMVATTNAAGGTTFDDPINAGLDLGGHNDRADLIIVTDGCAAVSDETIKRLQSVKKDCGLHMMGVTVGGGLLDTLQQCCDEILDLDATEDKEAALAKAFVPKG